jgi:hypothetical protein
MTVSKSRIRLAAVLYGILLLAMIVLGSYHITHGGGWRTGTTELCLAVFSLILAWRVYKIVRSGELKIGHRKFKTFLLVIIFAAVVLFLIFSAYHFTHDGLRSGIIELVSAAILITLELLIRSLIR